MGGGLRSRDSRGALLVATLVLALAWALPVQAQAAVRIKHDKAAEVRFELDGRSLTATVVDLPRYEQSPSTLSELSGRRVLLGCATSFRRSRRAVVYRTLRWPRGARSVTAVLDRDISRRVEWCLLEERERSGGDIAFVSFRPAEPGRVLTSGIFADGDPWRLVAWRGEQMEPCLGLRVATGSSSTCFSDEAEVEAGLSAAVLVPMCREEPFVVGAVARSARTVTVTDSHGATVAATLYDRPAGSRVRARYFLAVLTGGPPYVTKIVARDAEGGLVGRTGRVGRLGAGRCL